MKEGKIRELNQEKEIDFKGILGKTYIYKNTDEKPVEVLVQNIYFNNKEESKKGEYFLVLKRPQEDSDKTQRMHYDTFSALLENGALKMKEKE